MYQCSGVLEVGIVDHALIYGVRKKQKLRKNTRFVWARSYQRYDREAYYQDVLSTDWSTVFEQLR